MAGEHSQLVQLAHATTDPDARKQIMDALADVSRYAGGSNELADQLAAHVLQKLRSSALENLMRLLMLDSTT